MKFQKIGYKGFSLVEILVATGIAAALSVALMQMTKTQNKNIKRYEMVSVEQDIVRQIQLNLLRKEACEQTLLAKNIGDSITQIKNATGLTIFETGKKYVNNKLELTSIKTVNSTIPAGGGFGTIILEVVTKRLSKGNFGGKEKKHKYTISAQATSATGAIQECYADKDETISTAKEESCLNIGGTLNASDECELNCTAASKSGAVSTECLEKKEADVYDVKYLKLADGGTITGALKTTGGITSDDIKTKKLEVESEICIGGNCRKFTAQSCKPGEMVIKINADGSLDCRTITCPVNKYFQGFDAGGAVKCATLPTKGCGIDQFVKAINPDGSVDCEKLPVGSSVNCNAGEYIESITPDGTPSCVKASEAMANQKCKKGQVVQGFDVRGNIICIDAGGKGGDCISSEWNGYCDFSSGQSSAVYCFKAGGRSALNLGSHVQDTWRTRSISCPRGYKYDSTVSITDTVCKTGRVHICGSGSNITYKFTKQNHPKKKYICCK